MGFLVLSVASSAIIMVLFKMAGKWNIKLFLIIVINYFAAGLIGHLINSKAAMLQVYQFEDPSWLPLAAIIGFLLIAIFFVLGTSSQVAGISITSVASKMSVILPIVFSIAFYNENIYLLKVTGIFLALIAVLFSSIKNRGENLDKRYLFLPLITFLGTGTIDSLIKYAQQEYISPENSAVFTSILFGVAFLLGVLVSIFRRIPLKQFLEPRVFALGMALGIANYGSIYYLIRALGESNTDSSIIFGLNNIGVVALSVFIGLLFFREHLTKLNWSGVALSFVAIWLLSIA